MNGNSSLGGEFHCPSNPGARGSEAATVAQDQKSLFLRGDALMSLHGIRGPRFNRKMELRGAGWGRKVLEFL